MAWEHFTDYLSEGEQLTAAQYGELLDALEERIKAIDSALGYTADVATLRSAGLFSARVWIDAPALTATAEWSILDLLDLLGTWYSFDRDEPGIDGTTYEDEGTGLRYLAAQDLGLIADATDTADRAAVDALFAQPALDVRERWNLYRRMVQLLVIPRLSIHDAVTYRKETTDPDADPQLPAIQVATETSDAPGNLIVGYDPFEQSAQRIEFALNLDATLYAGTYPVWAIVQNLGPADTGTPRWKWGAGSPVGFPFDTTGTGTDSVYEELGSALAGTGEVAVELDIAGYYSGGGDYDDTLVDFSAQSIWAKPTFTHPFESI